MKRFPRPDELKRLDPDETTEETVAGEDAPTPVPAEEPAAETVDA